MKKILAKINKQALKKDAKLFLLIAGGGAFAIATTFWIVEQNSSVAKDSETKQRSVIIKDIPNAEENALHGDKRKAYEEEQMRVDVSKGTQNLSNFLPAMPTTGKEDSFTIPVSGETSSGEKRNETYRQTHSDFERSIDQLNNSVNQSQADNLFQTAQNTVLSDDEIIRIKQEEARAQAMQQFDEMMQKYYTPQPAQSLPQEENPNGKNYSEPQTALTTVSPIIAEKNSISSGLRASRRNGFYGSSEVAAQKNTIRASVYGKHVIQSGQFVRLRTDEPMQVGQSVLPTGSIVIGKTTLGEDRLFITVYSIEYSDVIYSVNLEVYDTDGMLGLYLPGSMEMETIREIGTNVANALGASATNSAIFQSQPSASEQLKTDVGRGLIQGTFKYAGRKLQTIKITVQDKHNVYLLPKNQ
jgi:conjugative transposon TraM protein